MQNSLFPDNEPVSTDSSKPRPATAPSVLAADHPVELTGLARQLPPQVRLGGSTWSYPGWQGMVWGEEYTPSILSRHGLSAYATHPLMRAVGIDRSFYRGLSAAEYAQYASQVPADFRFVVKGPASVCDAVLRESEGRGTKPNPQFLNADLAAREFVLPATEGLGDKLGVLCFQLSPLPLPLLVDMPLCLSLLETMLQGLPDVRNIAPNALVAVEVRDPEWLRPEFAELLKRHGAVYCLGGHPKMPPIEAQLPVLRALWPGPLVCRWLLNRVHGPFGQGKADKAYAPYDRFHHEDPHTRIELAKLAAVFAKAGQPVYITISNTAEGSAPLSVQALAREIVQQTS